jgi:hypothetical protein
MAQRVDSSLLSDGNESDEKPGDSDTSSESSVPPTFAFPELDAQIRSSLKEFGAVFPKLNFTSPRVRSPVFAILHSF